MQPLRDAWSLYKAWFLKIVLVSMIVTIPIQILTLYIANYFVRYFEVVNLTPIGFVFGTLINLVMISLIQIPFIQMVLQEKTSQTITVKGPIGTFMENGWNVYLLSLVYVFMIGLGTLLFIVPGMVVSILFFSFPYVVVIEKEKGWFGLKRAFQMGRDHFFAIAGILLVFGVVQGLLEMGILFGSLLLTNSFFLVALVQMFVSSLIYPLFIFTFSNYFLEWSGLMFDYEDVYHSSF
ncbi:hypothetical protein SAMN04488112_13311 [Melghirimyces thermohalophilus]|uniref:Membrane domain of glycerophosphoryl diester phosphodiesterase n=1 Tax=Melghirimyces thermohalophilus TaxID=1236220 RepID=A0A1G6RYI2_9BACL|nr:hypothetical protein [Melghirimyces thermohalophilus]SDD09444.1 hypothetical protein SAMN04488112_13311 [Melghirimyces thermohalophilus]